MAIKSKHNQPRKPLTDEERAEKQREQRERLQSAAEELRTTEGWQTWLTVRSTFRAYSLSNQILIAWQRPDATRVAGFRAWLKLGYQVRKGEKAIRILAPRVIRVAKESSDSDESADTGRRCVGFFDVSVFDVAQCEPAPDAEPLPLNPPTEPIDGDTHAHLLPILTTLADELGYTVEYRDLSGSATGGWCDPVRKDIVVDDSAPVNSRVRTLVHEISHAHGVDYDQFSRSDAEVIVESVTFTVLSSLGLDTSGESVAYVAGWGDLNDVKALREHADLIDKIATRIEDACAAPAPTTNSVPEAVAA